MDNQNGPYFRFDPSSIGWLHRRAEEGADVLNADLVRIIEANTELVPDPVLCRFVLAGLNNALKAKRGPKRPTSRILKELYIVALYDDLLPFLQARAERRKTMGRRKARADFAPAELACKLIGNRIGMEFESVRNLVSSLKNRD